MAHRLSHWLFKVKDGISCLIHVEKLSSEYSKFGHGKNLFKFRPPRLSIADQRYVLVELEI